MLQNKSIQHIFSQVPKTYERVNHLLTLGLDVLWRKKAVRIAIRNGGTHWLDLCTGTGETAVYLSRKAPADTQVFAVDFTLPMLLEAVQKSQAEKIRFLLADVRRLPFPDRYFDLITLAFAARNLNLNREILVRTFAEFHRVLKPGGRFVNLETSQPENFLIRKFFHFYIHLFVRQFGSRVSGSNEGYTYLASTIPRFYPAEELSMILSAAGFQNVTIQKMLFGATAVHVAQKGVSSEKVEQSE